MSADILESLNEKQREAVTAVEGPLLILAGAGSGKTKTITHRSAYLIREKGVRPEEILAVTFTNKAAGEMKHRIFRLLGMPEPRYASVRGKVSHRDPFVGTFHSLCVRILRQSIGVLGRDRSFHIFDASEQKKVMEEAMKELGLDLQQFKPRSFLAAVSSAKSELIDEADFSSLAQGYFEEMTAKAYVLYQKKLAKNNALDFDDILLYTVKLFSNTSAIVEQYQSMFRYIMVDEYQDTNKAQYQLIRYLSDGHRNICVVGDDAQSIYRFRGADIRNILEFEKDYPDAKTVFLEQNYRSTQTILDAADHIIANNVHRKEKKLWTERGKGEAVFIYKAADELSEARFVSAEIENLRKKKHIAYSDAAVLYRTNAQSRSLEEKFLQDGIPYRIVGGIRFYDRKEIKDIVGYLRLWINPSDQLAFERVVNEPKRGIGKKTIEKWRFSAEKLGVNMLLVGLPEYRASLEGIRQGVKTTISQFCEVMHDLGENIEMPFSKFLESVYRKTGYAAMLERENTSESKARKENILELLSVAKRYDELPLREASHSFLEEVALFSDTDEVDVSTQAVHCMTIHSAKGLEFPYVFIVGLEEGILPHSRSVMHPVDLEEERRLVYVGVTRAKRRIYLTYARQRLLFGSVQANPPSRFLEEIPKHLIEQSRDSEDVDEFFSSYFSPKKSSIIRTRERKKIKIFEGGEKRLEVIEKKNTKEKHFSDGEKVVHKIFGRGIVVSQNTELYTVVFQKAGIKKIAKKVDALERI